ncbi:aldo/keto reductase [Candidatus Poribacteria bacterium]|nr:aldo/keto reductase [Candidatus Poribacteria bacterium]
MEYRFLGASGLQVSALSFGSWVTFGDQINEEVALDCMKTAWDAGVNFFDNAESYAGGQSETIMGSVLKRAGWKRSDLVVSTKIFFGGKGRNDRGLSRKHILEGTAASLERLQLEYVDLIFCHRPDPCTPVEESVRAMSYIVNTGKAFYWGTSEWSADQIREAHAVARRERLVPPTMEQPQYHMLHRERFEKEYAPLYKDFGLGTTIWSPLACGVLTGKYNEGIPEGSRLALEKYHWLRHHAEGEKAAKDIATVRKLKPVAERLGCTQAQLALAWCLKNPHVSTVITGASKASQVAENMKSLDVVPKLTAGVMAEIETILSNKPKPDLDWRNM